MPAPGLLHFADLTVEVGAPIEIGDVGHGVRRLIPIDGGRCVARDWTARVLPGGTDFQLLVSERSARLEARYVLETDSGDRIYVDNQAVRSAAPKLAMTSVIAPCLRRRSAWAASASNSGFRVPIEFSGAVGATALALS